MDIGGAGRKLSPPPRQRPRIGLRRRGTPRVPRQKVSPRKMNAPTPNAGLAPSKFADPISRRRTFAIISHPDAGKTTLTEKLLLFGGAIQLAGQVRAKRNAT